MFTEEVMSGENSPSALEKFLRRTIIASCVIAGAVLVWFAGITPFMPFSRISVSPIEGLGREDILIRAGIGTASSYISTDARAIEKILSALPQIKQARVFKHFPDRLEIALEGREAAALAFAVSGGKTVPVYFDASGVVFGVGSVSESTPDFLPVISGLIIEDPYPGMRLPANFTTLLSELDSIRMASPQLLSAISEIRINRNAQDGFDLIVYPVHRQVKVRLSELNEDILKYTLLMIDVLSARESGLDLIDFRSGMASYYPGEE